MSVEENSIRKIEEEKKLLRSESEHIEKEEKESETKLSEETAKEITSVINTQRIEHSNPIHIPIKSIRTTKIEVMKDEYITEMPSVKAENNTKPILIWSYPQQRKMNKVEVNTVMPKTIPDEMKSAEKQRDIITSSDILRETRHITKQEPVKEVPAMNSFNTEQYATVSIPSKLESIGLKQFKPIISKVTVVDDVAKIDTTIDKESEKSLESKAMVSGSINTSDNDNDNYNDREIFEWLESEVLPFKNLGAIRTSPNRPICLILLKGPDESYIHTISLICRELYRIVKGGKPEPRWLSAGSKEEIEEHMKADNKIFVIDDTEYELLPDFSTKRSADLLDRVKESKLFDRLNELFSQDYGFIIFHIPKWADKFAELLNSQVDNFIPKIINLRPTKYMSNEMKKLVARICWGFVEVSNKGSNFDEIFSNAEKSYYDALGEVSRNVELKHYVNPDENAGFEHESLKLITVKALATELKREVIELLKEGIIETEYNINSGRADIYVKPKNRFIEIETLYGTEDPITKLDKVTLNKYKGMNANVDIVLLGLHILLYARDLYKLKKLYEREYNMTVNFYTINVKECRLVSIKELHGILKLYKLGI